jgi:hypothetical protein
VTAPPVPRIGERSSWDRVLGALEDQGLVVRRRGDGHVDARCPAHEDGRASMTADYRPGDPGCTLLCCHAGCEFGAIVAALGLADRDTFDGPSRDRARVPRPRPAARPVPSPSPARVKCRHRWQDVEVYRYTDRGEVVLEVVRQHCERCGGKNFPVRRPDGRGGWEWKWPDKRPLYRADEVRQAVAEGRTVLVVEGEKDVHAAERAGGVATCNPGGAGKWRPAHAAMLAGAARVVVVPDRDPVDPKTGYRPGYRHAAAVAESLVGGVRDELVVAEPAAGKDLSDHLAAGKTIAELVPVPAARLAELAARALRGLEPEPDPEPERGNVAHIGKRRGGGGQPPKGGSGGGGASEPERRPSGRVPMSPRAGLWGYAFDGEQFEGFAGHGLYALDGNWRKVAPLPYCHARIIRRDGSGTQVGTEFLLSASGDGPRKVVGDLAVHEGSWANELGLALSDDPKVRQAAGTAIREMAHADEAHKREAVPRIGDDGRVGVPVPECLPGGYLACAPATRAAGLDGWRRIVAIAAQAPKLAALIGAAVFAVFLSVLRRQTYWMELFGEAGQGKTTALSVAAGVWGNSVEPGHAVRLSWNDTAIGLGRHLGSLGILPAFLDEQGMAHFSPSDWGELIFKTCEGNQRLTAEHKSAGTRRSLPWGGVLFTSGNSRVTAGLGAGRYAGLVRRVVSIASPFTRSAAEAEALVGTEDAPGLIEGCYGHLGAEILSRFGADDARRFLADSASLVGMLPEDAVPRTLAKHLHAAVAGAAMVDAVLGTGTALTDAAAKFARAYLAEHGVTPEHDADRIISAVREAMAREPRRWPTRAEYQEHKRPRPDSQFGAAEPGRVELPQHFVAPEVAGVRADDGSWVAVFPEPFHEELAGKLGVDESLALAELFRRGVLLVARSKRAAGSWLTPVRLEPKPADSVAMYKLALPGADDEEDEVTGQPANNSGDSPNTESNGTIEPENGLSHAKFGADSLVTLATSQVSAGAGLETPLETPPETPLETPADSGRQGPPGVPESPSRIAESAQGFVTGSERFRAPAVVLDVGGAFLARADHLEALELPGLHGLADVAAWAAGLRLGVEHAAGYPDDAVAVILPELAARLGLPASVPGPKSKAAREHPALAALTAAGWLIAGQPVLASWMAVYRGPGTRTVRLWLPGWEHDTCPMWGDDGVPAVTLAYRLGLFAERLGIGWRLTGGITGVDLSKTFKRRSLRLASTDPPKPASAPLEVEIAWSRKPMTDEAGRGWLHCYDGNGAYTAAYNTKVNTGGWRHVEAPEFDKELPGYWLVDPPEWADRLLPDPFDPTGRDARTQRAGPSWRATPTLAGLAELGYEIRPREAWLPADGYGRWWEPWYERVRDARAALLAMAPDRDAAAVLDALRTVWHQTHGMITIASQGKRRDHDHTIIAAYRANLLRRLVAVGEAESRWPLAIATDNAAFASDDPDPRSACPAGIVLGAGLGQFKVKGTLPMADAVPLLGTGKSADVARLFDLARVYLEEHGSDDGS